MMITREQIIETIHKKFENHSHVYTLWLEGADSKAYPFWGFESSVESHISLKNQLAFKPA